MFSDVRAVVFDVDGTIFNSGKRILDYYPDYDPLEQTSYKLHGKYLELFSRSDFYQVDNLELYKNDVCSVVETYIANGTDIIFMSMSGNDGVRKAKEDMLKKMFNLEEINIMHTVGVDEEVRIRKLLDEYDDKVLFYDDAPHRFEMFKELSCNYQVVEQPYNRDYL